MNKENFIKHAHNLALYNKKAVELGNILDFGESFIDFIVNEFGVTLIEAVNPNISDTTYEEFWSNIFRDTSDNGPVDWGAYYDKMRGE